MFRPLLFCAGAGGLTALRPGWNPCRRSMELESFAISKSGVEKIFIIWPD
jgi:hypothetical protein